MLLSQISCAIDGESDRGASPICMTTIQLFLLIVSVALSFLLNENVWYQTDEDCTGQTELIRSTSWLDWTVECRSRTSTVTVRSTNCLQETRNYLKLLFDNVLFTPVLLNLSQALQCNNHWLWSWAKAHDRQANRSSCFALSEALFYFRHSVLSLYGEMSANRFSFFLQ